MAFKTLTRALALRPQCTHRARLTCSPGPYMRAALQLQAREGGQKVNRHDHAEATESRAWPEGPKKVMFAGEMKT